MARLQTLYLSGDRFAFIVDQHPSDLGVKQWHEFANRCGAADILITEQTIEIVDPFRSTLDAFIEGDDEPEPEPEKPWTVRTVDFCDAPEFIQRFIGAAFGDGPFAGLHKPCGDDCDCAATTPTDDEPATDNPLSGDDGAPAESGTVRQPCGYMPSADLARFAFDAADHPTPEEISARVAEKVRAEGGLVMELIAAGNEQLSGNLTEREKRIRLLAGVPDGEQLPQPQMTVTALDSSGTPTGEPVTLPVSAITITDPLFGDVTVPLTKGEGGPQIGTATVTPDGEVRAMIGEAIDAAAMQRHVDDAPRSGDWAPAAPVSERLCGAVNGKGEPCRQPSGHPYLHRFERVTL